MNTFSFVIHPLELKRDAARKYPILKLLPEAAIEKIALRMSPKLMSEISGVRSLTGSECNGYFIGCPLSTNQLVNLPPNLVYDRLVDAGKMSADLGAGIMGLGAFTSVAGDAGFTVAERLKGIIGVTSGNSYTVYTALEGLLRAAELMEVDIAASHVTIVGATGSIGAVCAKILAADVAAITLLGRDMEKLERLRSEVCGTPNRRAEISVANNVRESLREADLILAVSAAGKELIFPEDLKSGAVVCDVARPRDVSKSVVEKRNDVLVIEGGVIEVPGEVNFNFNFGFPDKTAYACMSETMLMALEGTYESYTLGRDLTVEQVQHIGEIARKHGFKLAGFRSFETAVTEETIDRVRQNAKSRRQTPVAALSMSPVAAPLQPLLIIAGPTASGKTALAVELCRRFNGEIISADSMQIYRGCDIVTAKPSPEELAAAPHHLLDIINPSERYSAAEWAKAADTLIDQLRAEGKTPIVCGGTGFYIRALLEPDAVPAPPPDPELRAALESELAEYGADVMHQRLQGANPAIAEKIHPNDHYRVLRALEIALSPNPVTDAVSTARHQPLAFAYEWPREELYQRIEQRVDIMLEVGAVEETRHIKEVWGADAPALGGVGYKQLLPALDDPAQLPECLETWKRDTRRYAKRQMTWFRHQLPTHWLDAHIPLDETAATIEETWLAKTQTGS